ncbi:MAG TPA: DUF2515 family protein [Polyangiaceae bacterium]|jgi:hypothetical protein
MPALERLLAELDARNGDNVSRTESYLELYAHTRQHPPELPWLLMAHLVSRNGGMMMTDVALALERGEGLFTRGAQEEMFLMLERANFLIFHDAWHHVLMHLLGRARELAPPRTPRFACEAWARHEREPDERQLVRDLVTNEQNLIERRVVRHPRFTRAMAVVGFVESIGRERPLMLPVVDDRITVGRFGSLERRIAAGWRIFDEVLAERGKRDAIFRWASEHPHTGSRSVHGGRATPTLRDAWPLARVRALEPGIHAPPEEEDPP